MEAASRGPDLENRARTRPRISSIGAVRRCCLLLYLADDRTGAKNSFSAVFTVIVGAAANGCSVHRRGRCPGRIFGLADLVSQPPVGLVEIGGAHVCYWGNTGHESERQELPLLANMRHSPPVRDTNHCAILSTTAYHSGGPAIRSPRRRGS